MQRNRRRYVVTGASSGIGHRSTSDLPSDFPDIAYHQTDLAGSVDAVVTLAAAADRLILAAGSGFFRPLESEGESSIAQTMAVNFGSVVRLLHGLYPSLLRNTGRVAILGSVAASGSAGMPVYSASKGALARLARSLSSEWQDRVIVRHYRLWPTRTPMHERAGSDARKIDWLMMDTDRVARRVIDSLETTGGASMTISPLTLLGQR